MATANLHPSALAGEGHHALDPFTSRPQDGQRQRYSAFDNSQFSLYLNGSPMQAKRALEAHLAETTRRLQETSHLGNALLQQRTELESRLQEVQHQEQEDDIGPELRQRLAELEKEFNEVGRETARAFLPKSRVPSGETDTTGGGSVYSSEAQHSPTKVSVPSRKQRNQQPSRMNDIALATEISTSLLSQLKELQAVLLEKEETLKAVDLDRSQLEIEVEGLSQRLRTLDESESRLKDVNWNLETQVREAESQSKSAADKEHRLNHALNLARSEKSTLERELEELKQMHTKLNDEHINKTRQHETELSSIRRNVTMGEMERGAIQRKVEELTTQNQELARAVAYRMKGEDHVQAEDTSPDDGGEEGDALTPEHSPPVSPSKATPRHGMLESETLKHSLQHAHRMIQQLKNNIHREKTEKVELKRMLQDARDELEKDRTLNVPSSASKRKKNDKDAFKKPARPDRLGALRGTQEVVIDDDEWEEQEDVIDTPSRRAKSFDPIPRAISSGFNSAAETSANEGFETANDTSDAAFETANERDGTTTETDAFQTGAETLDGDSSDDLTETEGGARSTVRSNRTLSVRHSHHDSYESTASNSGDEYDNMELRTPLNHQHSRLRLKSRPGSSRASTPRGGLDLFARTPSVARDSPASVSNSNRSTPAQGKSLFAELEDLSGDDDDGSYIEGTPSRSSVLQSRESSPDAFGKTIYEKSPLVFHPPRPMMVDSSTMTEASVPAPVGISSVTSHQTSPQAPLPPKLQVSSCSAHETSPQAPAPSKLQLSSLASQDTIPKAVALPVFQLSSVAGHATSPRVAPVPPLTLSSLSAHDTTPQPSVAPRSAFSTLYSQDTAPQLVVTPKSELSTLYSQNTVPQAPAPHVLELSTVSTHATEPRRSVTPPLSVSAYSTHATEPIAPVVEKPTPSALDVSSITHQATEPKESTFKTLAVPTALLESAVATHASTDSSSHEGSPVKEDSRALDNEPTTDVSERNGPPTSLRTPLQMSTLAAHATEPKDIPRAALSMSPVASAQATEPVVVKPTISQYSKMSSQATEPAAPTRAASRISKVVYQATEPAVPQLPRLKLSSLSSWSAEPMEAPKPALPTLSTMHFQDSKPMEPSRQAPPSLSTMSSQTTQPIELPRAAASFSTLSSQTTQPIEPPRALPTFSTMSSQTTQPVEPLRAATSQFSITTSQATEPRQPLQHALPQVSAISVQHTEPVALVAPVQSQQQFSNVRTVQDTQPESPTLPAFLPTPTSRPSTAHRKQAPTLTMSSVMSQAVEPVLLARPVTAHRTTPSSLGAMTSVQTREMERETSPEPKAGFFDSPKPWATKERQVEPVTPSARDRELRQPLTAIDLNAFPKVPRTPMSDGGTQTMVSAEQIDKLLLARNPRWSGAIATATVEKSMSPPGSPARRNSNEPGRTARRPGSSGSMRSRAASPPPLPSDHKEVIAAAAQKLSPPTSGTMGPPAMPASAYKKRPQTPSIKSNSLTPTPRTNGTTPRARGLSQFGDARSGASSPLSRQSSLSSFTSELDQRFNIPGGPSFAQAGIPAGATDPEMIQSITQTMIGEYLWKYTRKAGRGGMSENRHRRFFWLHPYTRTLYWSDQDPQSAGKSELKAKSVAVLSVKQVEDTNPLPPGLHQMSLIVTTPGRSIMFTAPTGRRHTTWFQALEYLCKRVDETEEAPQQQQERQQQRQQQKALEVDEIQDEFNGGYRSSSRMTGRSRASVSSHMTKRTASPHHAETPTLRPSAATPHRMTSTEALQASVSNRFSGLLRPTSALRGSYSSRRSRVSVQDSVTPEEPSGSNLDLSRDIHEHVHERGIDGMPNVRACCGGQHDVAHLHKDSVQGRHNPKTVNPRPSLIGSMSSRISSRAESRNDGRSISRTESRNEPRSISRNEPRTSSRTSSRVESYAEARNDRIRHQTDMESANFGAGA